MTSLPIRVTIWNEFIHEQTHDAVRSIYPKGIHGAIADALCERLGSKVMCRVATLHEPEHGLTEETLAQTDVLFWWGHAGHDLVQDSIVDRVQNRVLAGMGLVVLHSGHASKIFRRMMGTSCMLRWREAAEKERVWIVNPGHALANGLEGECFEIEHGEMYGEFFDVPPPDELVFVSWHEGGEVFRSGCVWRRGKGKVIYLSPGHETFPIYYHPAVQTVLANAAIYAAPSGSPYFGDGRNIPVPLSPISTKHDVDESLHRG